jgi:sugar diacid utilization regulator
MQHGHNEITIHEVITLEQIFGSYFQRLVGKVDRSSLRSIQIVSRDGSILAKATASSDDIPIDIIRRIIQDLDFINLQKITYNNSGEYTIIATPIVIDLQVIAVILIESINLKHCEQIITIIRTSLETYIEYHNTQQEASTETSREEKIVKELLLVSSYDLGKRSLSHKLLKSLKSFGFDLFLLRSVILIKLEKKTNSYFNINLDLGYESSVEVFKDKGVQVIKANKYLNNQDIVAFADNDHIVIVKSFLDTGDIGKLYYALDNICKEMISDLEAARIFSYHIAYGGIYSTFYDTRKSYVEAANTIHLGAIFQDNPGIYSVDQGIFEHVGYYLPPIVQHKVIQSILEKLKKTDGTIDLDLLFIAEEFVDQCMNLMHTANKLHLHRNTVSLKIDKFKNKTGLNPEKSFQDAFIIKMTAISVKIKAFSQEKSSE